MKHLKKKIILILHKLFLKVVEGPFPTYSMRPV